MNNLKNQKLFLGDRICPLPTIYYTQSLEFHYQVTCSFFCWSVVSKPILYVDEYVVCVRMFVKSSIRQFFKDLGGRS
jgi:hypothetical protein